MINRWPLLVFAAVMAAIPLIPGVPPFWIVLLDNIGLAALVAMGLVLLTGVGGLTSFGQAAFCGFGAYTTAVLATAYGVSPWLALPASLVVSGIAAVIHPSLPETIGNGGLDGHASKCGHDRLLVVALNLGKSRCCLRIWRSDSCFQILRRCVPARPPETAQGRARTGEGRRPPRL